MPYNKSAYLASKKYKEKNIKRIPLDVQIDMYQEIRNAAEAKGESVNGFVKTAIRERLDREDTQEIGCVETKD